MYRIATFLILFACLIPATAGADYPAAGKFLVATEELRGAAFARTVILLLRYDETGAMGLVVNRPTEAALAELSIEALSNYRGTLYWGGPVQMSSVRALLHSDAPPEGAMTIVDDVHLIPFGEAMPDSPTGQASLRFFIGYAGWAPGQLDGELAAGSWDVLPATADIVFAEDPDVIWQRLTPVRQYRAAIESGLNDGSMGKP
jgi:putative transcriptional regulator